MHKIIEQLKEPKLKLSEEERKELWSNVEWGTFRLLDYFQSFGGKLLTSQWCLSNPGNINFITSSTSNNGVNQKIDAKKAIKEGATLLRNVISVSTNGQSCWAFYQDQPCIIGLDAVGLIPNIKLSKLQSLFICTMIRKEAFRFNYGRKLNTERLEKLTIGLPKAQDGTPDWNLIEKLAASSDWTAKVE